MHLASHINITVHYQALGILYISKHTVIYSLILSHI